MTVFRGIDWASDHHDVALVDTEGKLLAKARISDDIAGFNELISLLAEHGDAPASLVPVAIETSRGLLVANLQATGRPVYAINPMAAARYRERSAVSRKKSDHLDAMTLAGILRTDRDRHRPLPADTELAKAIAILARAQQDAVWDHTQAGNKLRSHLREYFGQYEVACRAADALEKVAAESFRQHADAAIITSFPGLGMLLGARLLGELGDDPTRFADARGLKAYAGAAPVTRASGKTLSVNRRRVKNDRLSSVGYLWAFSALIPSPGVMALYRSCREAGQYHAAALRRLFHKLLGSLHYCLKTRTPYDESIAFPATSGQDLQLAA